MEVRKTEQLFLSVEEDGPHAQVPRRGVLGAAPFLRVGPTHPISCLPTTLLGPKCFPPGGEGTRLLCRGAACLTLEAGSLQNGITIKIKKKINPEDAGERQRDAWSIPGQGDVGVCILGMIPC